MAGGGRPRRKKRGKGKGARGRKRGGEERAEPPQAPTKNAQKQPQARSPASSPEEGRGREEQRAAENHGKGKRDAKNRWGGKETAQPQIDTVLPTTVC